MLLAGDEFGRTQQGNNNAYCQDSPLSWVDWSAVSVGPPGPGSQRSAGDERKAALLAFARRVFTIRRQNPVLRRRGFFHGVPIAVELESDSKATPAKPQDEPEGVVKDLAWLRPDGREMTVEDWNDPGRHALGMIIPAEASDELDDRGRTIAGNTLLLLVNGGDAPVAFRLPVLRRPGLWREVVNTSRPGKRFVEIAELSIPGHALILLEYEEA
jgi:glycogen operon protein